MIAFATSSLYISGMNEKQSSNTNIVIVAICLLVMFCCLGPIGAGVFYVLFTDIRRIESFESEPTKSPGTTPPPID